MEGFFEELTKYLIQKYNCHSVFLYGSYSFGDYTDESDVDIICFSDHKTVSNDINLFKGKQLDIWIHHTDKLNKPDDFLSVKGGKILLNQRNLAETFLLDIEAIFKKGPKKLSLEEKEFIKGWLFKMYKRTSKNDLEGNYRYYWLLKESLEIYFELKGLWYLGPKKSFRWLKENDDYAYKLFESVFQKAIDPKDIEELLAYLKSI